jgi:magnesium transporter
MNTETVIDEPTASSWQQLRALIKEGDGLAIQALMESLGPSESIRGLFRLEAEEQDRLLSLLSPVNAAGVLEDMPDSYAAGFIDRLSVGRAADIVEELSSEHGADLLAELHEGAATTILAEMTPETAQRVRSLIGYPADVAGGLMGPEEYAYPESHRVGDFVDNLRARRPDLAELPQRILLLDTEARLFGAVDIADILLAKAERPLAELMQSVVTVPVTASLDEMEAYFDTHDTPGVPVIDEQGFLVGRLRRRALYDAIAEKFQNDQLKTQGIVGGDEIRTMPVLSRSRRRLSWLSINIVLNIMAASVIAAFQDTLSAVIALAVFLPIVSDMSGCSGNQAVAVSMRELALGIIAPGDVLRVWGQEAMVGVLNGSAVGLLIAVTAFLWQGNPLLGAVIGLSLALNTVIAVSIGGTVPLLLKAWGADPAIASGPVLTTVTDMCGFFLVLGLATVALPWLV